MSNERLYVDFHVVQTVPPSCVNRDDTGRYESGISDFILMEVSFSLLSQLQGIKYVNIYYGLMQQKRVYYMVLF